MKKGLYIVATPIGNIADISERAKELLNNADVIACEDTRVTKKLLNLLNISLGTKKFIPLHDHNEQEKAKKQIILRITPSLWEEIAKWADDDFRSINSQIEFLLTEAVKKRKG